MAEQIVALVNGCIDQLIATLPPVEAETTAEEFAAYKRGVAKVINAFDVEIIDRIAREYPDLQPDRRRFRSARTRVTAAAGRRGTDRVSASVSIFASRS